MDTGHIHKTFPVMRRIKNKIRSENMHLRTYSCERIDVIALVVVDLVHGEHKLVEEAGCRRHFGGHGFSEALLGVVEEAQLTPQVT